MRTFLKVVALTFPLSFLLLSWLYCHSVDELALAQSAEGFTPLTYSQIFDESEQLAVISLPSGGPSARSSHTAIKDELNNDMIIFGGTYFDIEAWTLYEYNDVWKLDLDSYAWSQISTSGTPPSPRYGHTSIYDPVDDRMVVFGGALDVGVSNQVYELDLNSYTWSLLSPAGETPSPRWEHCAVYNSQDHAMAIFGGRDLSGTFNDLWILDLYTLVWRRVDFYGPSPRIDPSAIYIPDRNSMLLFGGSNYMDEPWPYTQYNDLWEFSFDTETWIELFPSGTLPAPKDACLASYDGVNNRILIFAGVGNYGVKLNDLWELDLNTLTWDRLFPQLARDKFDGVFDESKQELIFFGGESWSDYYVYDDGFRILISATSPAFENGDVNCDGERDIADVVYLLNYFFAGGPEPCTIR